MLRKLNDAESDGLRLLRSSREDHDFHASILDFADTICSGNQRLGLAKHSYREPIPGNTASLQGISDSLTALRGHSPVPRFASRRVAVGVNPEARFPYKALGSFVYLLLPFAPDLTRSAVEEDSEYRKAMVGPNHAVFGCAEHATVWAGLCVYRHGLQGQESGNQHGRFIQSVAERLSLAQQKGRRASPAWVNVEMGGGQAPLAASWSAAAERAANWLASRACHSRAAAVIARLAAIRSSAARRL